MPNETVDLKRARLFYRKRAREESTKKANRNASEAVKKSFFYKPYISNKVE